MARVEVFARTETGCARERNEDAFLVLSLASRRAGQLPEQRVAELAPPGVVLAVCDGMGGAAAGDVASQLATRALEEVALRAGSVHDPQQAASVLVEGVQAASVNARAARMGSFMRVTRSAIRPSSTTPVSPSLHKMS